MPPGRAAEASSPFSTGALVWVRVQGYPVWPGQVSRPLQLVHTGGSAVGLMPSGLVLQLEPCHLQQAGLPGNETALTPELC